MFFNSYTQKYKNVLILEDIISHKTRKVFQSISFFLGLMSFVGFLFVEDALSDKLLGASFGFLFLFIVVSLFEFYFYSFYFKSIGKKTMESFELAQILFYAEDNDVVKGLLFSDIGDDVMKRLGFSEEEISDILKQRESIDFEKLANLRSDMTLKQYTDLIFEKDTFFRQKLEQKQISKSDFYETIEWIVELEEKKILEERWWGEFLQRRPSLGRNWAHDGSLYLEKNSVDLTETNTSYLKQYEETYSDTVSLVEHSLLNSKFGHIILFGDIQILTDIFSIFAKRIQRMNALAFFKHSRMFFVDCENLLKKINDKNDLEFNLKKILEDISSLKNGLIVFSNFSKIVEMGQSMNIYIIPILLPHLQQKNTHFVFLENSNNTLNPLSKDLTYLSFVEIVEIPDISLKQIIFLCESTVQSLENDFGVHFTFKALRAVAFETKNKHKPFEYVDYSRKILQMSAFFAKEQKRKFVLESDVLSVIN